MTALSPITEIIEDIRVGLTTFTPSTAQTPGRLNIIEIEDFTVLMDFAHNPAGYEGLRDFIGNCGKVTIGNGRLGRIGDEGTVTIPI